MHIDTNTHQLTFFLFPEPGASGAHISILSVSCPVPSSVRPQHCLTLASLIASILLRTNTQIHKYKYKYNCTNTISVLKTQSGFVNCLHGPQQSLWPSLLHLPCHWILSHLSREDIERPKVSSFEIFNCVSEFCFGECCLRAVCFSNYGVGCTRAGYKWTSWRQFSRHLPLMKTV